MSEHAALGQPRVVAAWLAEGPEQAPSGLLQKALDRTATTRQRSSIVAVALGAPSIGGRASRPMSLRLWVVGALLVLAAVMAIAVAGSLRQQRPITTVLPSSPPASVLHDSPIPSGPASSDRLPFDAGENVYVAWSAVNPWTEVLAIPGGNPTFMADHLREVVFDSCVSQCTGRFVIDFIVGRIDEGLVYGWQRCPNLSDAFGCAIFEAENGDDGITLAVEGASTDELAAGWQAAFGPAHQVRESVVNAERWQILTYADRSVGIVAKGSRLVAVTVRAQGGLPADAVPVMLERFLTAIQFGADPNPGLLGTVSATLGDITVTMPGDFAIGAGPTRLSMNKDTGSFLVIDDLVTRLKPGDTMRIERSGGTTPSTFEVRGTTLAEVTSSIDAALGTARRTDLRIADALGYRWRVTQAAIVHPLVAVAVIEWKGSFYVFEEHFPIEAASAGNFDLVLQRVTLQ